VSTLRNRFCSMEGHYPEKTRDAVPFWEFRNPRRRKMREIFKRLCFFVDSHTSQ